MPEYSEDEVLERLKDFVREAGTPAQAAKLLRMSPQYLGDILKGNRSISATTAEKLGFRKKVSFVEE